MGGETFRKIIMICVHERGFVYLFWLRLTQVKSPLKPFFWLIYHHLSSKYGIQISTRTPIGPGLYIGHGVGIVINASAKIGKNVTLSQFLYYIEYKGYIETFTEDDFDKLIASEKMFVRKLQSGVSDQLMDKIDAYRESFQTKG